MLVTAALLYYSFHSLSVLPPLGSFLNPQSGFWANAEPTIPSLQLSIPGVKAPITVHYDSLGVPHIFAQNDHDLFLAQGYVTARDRLWQMEIQTHSAAGRLSEILGSDLIGYDKRQRRLGMGFGAERRLEAIRQDSASWNMVQAYSDGINAYISSLDPAEYPLEYKILNYAPERWKPIKSVYLLMNMAYTLSSGNSDLRMSNTMAYLGPGYIKHVLDRTVEQLMPIIPESQEWSFDPLETSPPDSFFVPSVVDTLPRFTPNPHPNNGSNNWAVSGEKTASGHPILATDPHLNMTLPSIWYVAHLHSPSQNVMGATLPGAPAVIMGFNEHTAWGMTNVGSDVLDWYEIQFKDGAMEAYLHDGQYREVTERIEEIRVKGAETVYDTVRYTHHGPVHEVMAGDSVREPVYHAMRWIAHDASNEIHSFMKLNRARDYDEYREAISHYKNPAQNFIFASRDGDIAITPNGKFPLKWKDQGRFVSDGSSSAYDWQQFIPFEQNPTVKNPPRGFVSSANQHPANSSYPYYLDANFAPYERGRRVNDLLTKADSVTVGKMAAMQIDTYSYHAATLLPFLLETVTRDTLSEPKQQILADLERWDVMNDAELTAPATFDRWWREIYRGIWADEIDSSGIALQYPDRDKVVDMILENDQTQWIDNHYTEEREDIGMIVDRAFEQMAQTMHERYGPFGEAWQWGEVNPTHINHIASIPGMGARNLATGGGRESINAINGSHGPSWRMVVELDPTVKGYGVYPGGQSGNPGSPFYDNLLPAWRAGSPYPLALHRQASAAETAALSTLTLQPQSDEK